MSATRKMLTYDFIANHHNKQNDSVMVKMTDIW